MKIKDFFKGLTKPQESGERRNTMYSQELIEKVAERTGYTKTAVEEVYKALLEEIKESLNSGEDVNLYNFGRFYVSEMATRKVHCPTGEVKKIKAHNTIRFTAGRGLKKIAPKK